MDHKKLKSELLIAIRGGRSQGFINRRLGYNYNQVSKWERGLKRIYWPDFVKFCDVCKIDLKDIINKKLNYPSKPESFNLLIKHLTPRVNIIDIAEKIKVSKFIVRRWLCGQTPPTLENILSIIENFHMQLVDFLDVFVDLENIPTLNKQYAKRKLVKELQKRHPYFMAIDKCFYHKKYLNLKKHEDGFVSKKIGISLEEEKEAISKLKKIGAIKLVNNKYQGTAKKALSNLSYEEAKIPLMYWFNRSIQKISKIGVTPKGPKSVNRYFYNIFNVNDEDVLKIKDEIIKFKAALNDIIKTSKASFDKTVVVNIHMLDLTDN